MLINMYCIKNCHSSITGILLSLNDVNVMENDFRVLNDEDGAFLLHVGLLLMIIDMFFLNGFIQRSKEIIPEPRWTPSQYLACSNKINEAKALKEIETKHSCLENMENDLNSAQRWFLI